MRYLLKNKLVRVFLFSTLGFINSFFMKFSKDLPFNDVLILGRGESLNLFIKNYEKFSHIKHIVLINFSQSDFKNFDANIFNNKIIHLSLNIVEQIIPFNLMYKYTFGKIFFARYLNYKPDGVSDDRKNFKANVYANKVEYFPTEMKDLWWTRNCGIFTIAYFASFLKVKNIYLFGFDFYQGDYHDLDYLDGFRNNYLNEKKAIYEAQKHKDASSELIKNLKLIINKYQSINFYLPDTKNYRYYNYQNVKKINNI